MNTLFVVAVIVAALLVLRAVIPKPKLRSDLGPPALDATPDTPRGFGYKVAWIAVEGVASEHLAAALGLTDVRPVNWRDGLAHAYEGMGLKVFSSLDGAPAEEFRFGARHSVFVSPPVDGWTFAIGERLAFLESFAFKAFGAERAPERLIPFLEASSRALATEVRYFFTHRVPETHIWALADRGRVVRAYGVSGERGVVLFDVGPLTEGERSLGLDLPSPSEFWLAEGKTSVDEQTVIDVAAKWTLDPLRLEANTSLGVGLLGRMD